MKDLKVKLLKGMHEYVRNINDERAYMRWINIVPDEPMEDDFEFIAEDKELWTDTCELFADLVKRYE